MTLADTCDWGLAVSLMDAVIKATVRRTLAGRSAAA